MFKPLTKENITGIVDLLLAELNRRLTEKQLSVSLTDKARDYVIECGYDPIYGARPLRRFLQKNVETLAAREILGGKLSAGDTIKIDADENGLKVV
jgi:ATP-dependent Clp protease ATP-binding subunit ClpB